MADIIKPEFHPRPREVRLDGLRGLSDGDTDALEALGMGRGIPHAEGCRQVDVKTLKEWCGRLLLVEAEAFSLRQCIESVIGDDKPEGAA